MTKKQLSRAERRHLTSIVDTRGARAVLHVLAQHYRAYAHPHGPEYINQAMNALETAVDELRWVPYKPLLGFEVELYLALLHRENLFALLYVLADHYWEAKNARAAEIARVIERAITAYSI